MNNNDILRRFRYALDIKDYAIIEIFELAGNKMEQSRLTDLLKKEDEPGFIECDDEIVRNFFDGYIIFKRGKREDKPGQAPVSVPPLNNNLILKKIRIALEFKEDDMLDILRSAGADASKSELSALFRRKGHRNYKPCGDQFLRNFLNGLTTRFRK